jgi:hypothetical protein
MQLFACSGPGAASAMLRSTEYGYDHAAYVVGLLVLSLALSLVADRRRFLPFVVAALLLLHPAWTFSAYGGDCGYSKMTWAFAFTIMAASIVVLQIGLLARTDFRKLVNGVLVASWLATVSTFAVAAHAVYIFGSSARTSQEDFAIIVRCVVALLTSAAVSVVLTGAWFLFAVPISQWFRLPTSDVK